MGVLATNGSGQPSELAKLALEIALSQLGQQETAGKANSGPMVDKYLAAVGLSPGYAWCQAFVNWCYEQAAAQIRVPEPVVNTGGVLDCWRRSSSERKIRRATIVADISVLLPGDQFIMQVGAQGAGHTGLIVGIKGTTATNAILLTIEGNTNDEGGREGYKVARRERKLMMQGLLGVIRYR